MSSKRYNIWLDIELILKIKKAALQIGVKTSTYMRMAILEKLNKDEKNNK